MRSKASIFVAVTMPSAFAILAPSAIIAMVNATPGLAGFEPGLAVEQHMARQRADERADRTADEIPAAAPLNFPQMDMGRSIRQSRRNCDVNGSDDTLPTVRRGRMAFLYRSRRHFTDVVARSAGRRRCRR